MIIANPLAVIVIMVAGGTLAVSLAALVVPFAMDTTREMISTVADRFAEALD